MQNDTIRIDKFLANSGVTSRRNVKTLLKKSDVLLNGERVTEVGTRINPDKDRIIINGKNITGEPLVYFIINKPKGIISTVSDQLSRKTVISLVPTTRRIYPVGRLDKDTHGLLLLTNDGELTHKLTHPRYHVKKVYQLRIMGIPTPSQLKALRSGVLLNDGITKPAEAVIIQQTKKDSLIRLVIHEGRNRQIRRMCDTVGLKLIDLERIAFGPLTTGNCRLGEYRRLTEKEVCLLKESVLR